jgi:hypothetical protein
MVEKIPGRPSLPKLRDFAKQFRQKYGRDMTPEEQKFFTLTEDLLENPPEEDSKSEDAS